MPEALTIATVVGIVGGLLIAAAFLAFIAANWTVIARPLRFAILLAGIVGAYGAAALFDRAERNHLADLAAGVGSIIFGAAIALVGQMYHLGDDFAGGLLLWASGALVAAALTGSRSALAVALAAGCVWSGMRVDEMSDVHPQFAIFWLIAAMLALTWQTTAARHLVAVAALVGAVLAAVGVSQARIGSPNFTLIALVSLMIGAGLLLTTRASAGVRAFGLTLSTYGAFGLSVGLAGTVVEFSRSASDSLPYPILGIAAAASLLAFAATLAVGRAGPALAGISTALALVMTSGLVPTAAAEEPWLAYALALTAMLCLVVSGMLDDVRPRIVAGWLGLAATIAADHLGGEGLAAAARGVPRGIRPGGGRAGDPARAADRQGASPMTAPQDINRTIPRPLLFALAAAIQIALIAMMVYDRVRVLREGTEVTLQTRPVDPRDFLRGDYVVLNYEISNLPAGALKDTPSKGRGTPVYVKLVRKPTASTPPSPRTPSRCRSRIGEVLIRGRVLGGAVCGADASALRDAADQLRHRELFRAGGRGQGDRTRPQRRPGVGRRGGDADRTRRHQAAAGRRQAGLR